MIPQIILSTEPTKAFIYLGLRAEPGDARLQAHWNVELTSATSDLPYPQAKYVSSSSNSANDRYTVFCSVFYYDSFSCICSPLSFVRLLQHTLAQRGFAVPSNSKAVLLCERLWGASGVVRGFHYQIERKDYIDTRLKHHCCLLGILTIITLVLQGHGTAGGREVLGQGRGAGRNGVLWR